MQKDITMTEKEKEPCKDEQTQKRIHEHLRNETDVISEEDIANVKPCFGEEKDLDSSNEPEAFTEKEKGEQNEDEKKEDVEGARIETPWNILGK
jgi:hypothetical protein